MTSARSLAGLAVLLLLAILVVSVVRGLVRTEERDARRATSPGVGPSRSDRATAERPEVHTSAETARQGTVAEERVRVRSTLGLELREVELEADPHWRVQALDEHGQFELPLTQRPLRIRARGHLPILAKLDTRELALAPHTALRFSGFPVDRVEQWRPCTFGEAQPPEIDLALLAGPLDATSWGLAFDSDRLAGLFPYLPAEFRFDDGTRASVEHGLLAGRDDSIAWPWPPLEVARSILTVTALGPALEGPFELFAHAATELRPRRDQFVRFEWGSIERRLDSETWQMESRQPGFELGPLVLGKDYIVTLRDRSSGAHARRRFTHEGATLDLVLSDGLVVTGRVTFEPAVGLREFERVVWEFGGRGYWRGEPRPIPLGPNGDFRFSLPEPVPWADMAPFPRPTHLALEFRMPGFLPYRHACDTAGIGELELGTLALTPRKAVAILAPGHGFEPGRLFDQTLVLEDEGDFARELLLAGALPFQDGSLGLSLDEISEPPELARCEALLLQIGDDLVPLARGQFGFLRQTTNERRVRLVVGARQVERSARLEVGLAWRGINYPIRSWPTRALLAPVELKLALPADAQLWWGPGQLPTERHVIALRDEVTVLQLP